jgi:putative spermidine/putrescine transport system ATP-binding protein/spermidine/putrescine transport system ATP-binding protein
MSEFVTVTSSAVDVRFARVTKRYGDTTAVKNVTLDIPRGSFFSLLGPSGCGKTTMLRLIAGFELPDEGDVFIRQAHVNDIPPYRRDFAMVFQNFALFPASDRGRQCRLRPAHERRRKSRAGRGGGECARPS